VIGEARAPPRVRVRLQHPPSPAATRAINQTAPNIFWTAENLTNPLALLDYSSKTVQVTELLIKHRDYLRFFVPAHSRAPHAQASSYGVVRLSAIRRRRLASLRRPLCQC
jgi:hypothetical protein